MDALTIAGTAFNIQQVLETIYSISRAPDRKISDHITTVYQDWVIDLDCVMKRLEEENATLRDRLGELAQDPDFCRVQNNYCFEAAREAIDERRTLLAYAFAGSLSVRFSTDVSTTELSRVERTIRELERPDLVLLAEVQANNATRTEVLRDDQSQFAQTSEIRQTQRANKIDRDLFAKVFADPSGEALLATGCLKQLNPNAMDAVESVRLTRRGELVLKVMAFYLTTISPILTGTTEPAVNNRVI